MKKDSLSRRYFLQKAIFTGSALLGVGALITACGNATNENSTEAKTPDVPTATEIPNAQNKSSEGVAQCDDFSNVSEAELAKRKQFAYVDETEIPESRCNNCQLFISAKEGDECGGCMLFKGPVHDDGYCTYWSPQV